MRSYAGQRVQQPIGLRSESRRKDIEQSLFPTQASLLCKNAAASAAGRSCVSGRRTSLYPIELQRLASASGIRTRNPRLNRLTIPIRPARAVASIRASRRLADAHQPRGLVPEGRRIRSHPTHTSLLPFSRAVMVTATGTLYQLSYGPTLVEPAGLEPATLLTITLRPARATPARRQSHPTHATTQAHTARETPSWRGCRP